MVIIVFTYLWVLFRTGYRGGEEKGGFVGLGIGVFVEIKSRYMMGIKYNGHKLSQRRFVALVFFLFLFFLLSFSFYFSPVGNLGSPRNGTRNMTKRKKAKKKRNRKNIILERLFPNDCWPDKLQS